MVGAALGLEAGHGTPRGASRHAGLDRQIEQEREVGQVPASSGACSGIDQRQPQTAGIALVDPAGIGKAVAEHPCAARQRRQDRAVEMVVTGGEEEVELAQGTPALRRAMNDQLADRLRTSVPPGSRVTRSSMPRPEDARQAAALRALAGPLPAFQRDEPAARHPPWLQEAWLPKIR